MNSTLAPRVADPTTLAAPWPLEQEVDKAEPLEECIQRQEPWNERKNAFRGKSRGTSEVAEDNQGTGGLPDGLWQAG